MTRSATVVFPAPSLAVVFGMVCGAGLFVATVWLLIRGGPDVGRNLGLLSNYYPGYDVTWPGAVVGLFYGAVFGALVGWSTAWIYNQVTEFRERRRMQG